MNSADLSAKLHGADFFVTGGTQAQVGLDFNFIPCNGVNFSSDGQTLQEGYSIAKKAFECVNPKTIKFVIIGLPLNFNDQAAKFLNNAKIKAITPILKNYCKLCFDNGARPVVVTFPVEKTLRKTFKADNLKQFGNAVKEAGKNYKIAFVDLLGEGFADDYFEDKARLNSLGAMVVSALITARLYSQKVIVLEEILAMPNDYFGVLSKNFLTDYKNLTYHIFCKMACDDFKRLTETMPADECKDLMARVFAEMTYEHLSNLSDMLSKDDYNDVAARIFKISAEKLRHKSKIKVGFYVSHSSMWFGDDLYNLFARDERFEPTFFTNMNSGGNNVISKERSLDAKRFLEHGINTFDLADRTQILPVQDILFCLTPYQNSIFAPFRIINLKLTTLLINLSYSFSVCDRGNWHGSAFFRVLWKRFFPAEILLDLSKRLSKVGMPRGLYSGYPKMDIFFQKDSNFKFDWKMARPDAKKIIWAPHHSITNNGPVLATFQWNYQFMYEFAKAHPEISWVVKTHSALPAKAVSNKIFPSIYSYTKYMQKWDDLPNAQVYYGAYYEAIFATSDGMIQDCGSFIAEYQYVDKPMIYLTRDTQKFNELGEAILKASYLVDGKDLDAIAAMMQRVFIDGDDYKAAERKEVFDKYLNYPKANGMLASEFIFKNITDEFKEV